MRFSLLEGLWNRVETNKTNINKHEISREILSRLNSNGEATLRERREIIKRTTEFEDFSTCWPGDQLKARGLVAHIRQAVDLKDSFTRMRSDREQEMQQRIAEQEKSCRNLISRGCVRRIEK